DAVEDGPIIDRITVGIFPVCAGRTPFERWGSVTGCQEVVGAKISCFRSEPAQLAEEFSAIFHVGIVRLVRAKESPNRTQLTLEARSVHMDDYCVALGRHIC